MKFEDLRLGHQYLTKTNGVYQNNQQPLDNRVVTVQFIDSPDQIICRVDFENEDSVYLPFGLTELNELN